ncbi:MAG: hypothetical protein Kow00127_11800 [Bacteroidales bacterium]
MSSVEAQVAGSWVVPFNNLGTGIDQLEFGDGQIQSIPLNNFGSPDSYRYTAGGYDQNGELLFYIAGKQVYEAANNNFVGNFHTSEEYHIRPEVEIVRIPGTTGTYNIIYSAYIPGGDNYGGFYYSEVFVDPETHVVTLGQTEQYLPSQMGEVWSFGGIALSGLQPDQTRLLYRCSMMGITVTTIDATGILNDTQVLLDPENSIIGDSDNFLAWNFEMYEKAGGGVVFAWNTMNPNNNDKDKVFIYDMDATTNPVQKIDIDPNTTGEIGGIEFSHLYDDVLYVSYHSDAGGSGLIKLDYANGTTTPVSSGDNFSHTFLQHAPDGQIYGVSDDGNNLGMLDEKVNGNFSPDYFSNGEVYSFIERSGIHYYILPENEKSILTMETTSTNIACEGNTDGEATAAAFGGVPPYTYQWTNNAGEVIGTGPTITGLGQGLYTCCITDSDAPPVEVCETIQISVDPNLLPFDYYDERIVHYDPQNPVTNWSQPVASGFYRIGIRVEAGQTLNIGANSLLEFHDDAKIIVEPGATLNIENSTLTHYAPCPYRWKGIEVWGNASESQYVNPQDGIQYQGKLTINHSTIEHAAIAVDLWKPGDYSKTGGIVIAENTTFSNNTRSLHAINYQNFNVGNEMPMDNVSYFKYCTFELTDNYMPDMIFYKHVDMAGVDGIKFKACTFTLQPEAEGVSPWNQAIAAYNAGFDVMPVCTSPPGQDCTGWDICTFTGFYKGIYAAGANSDYTFFVSRAGFINNQTGIYASEVKNLVVLLSDFTIGINNSDSEICESKGKVASGFGINLVGCTGFGIEENHFAPATTGGYYTGIKIKDCPSKWDIIYKNEFNGLSYGNYAQGINRSDPDYDQKGVEYQCNLNTNNDVDFIVTDDIPKNAMIRTEQGSQDVASGNTFSETASWHYRNEGLQYINYFYCEDCPNEEPDMNRVYTTNGAPLFDPDPSNENTCPSHYGNGGGGTDGRILLSNNEKQERELTFSQNLSDYQNVRALFDNLKDGGNTEALKSEVETSWPQDMWELRAELLGKSPHLSKEVLMKAADKTDVLPESILFEILSANPDELKEADLIQYLEEKEQPLPQYMIDILQQLSFGVTYKTILKRQMAEYHANKSQAALDMIRSTLADTVMDLVQLRNWLDNLGGISADKQIISSYITEKNYSDAQSLLDLLPSLYELEGQALTDYNDYKNLIEMQMNWQQQGRSIFELDSLELALLQNYADNSNGEAKNIARGILEFAYGFHYCDCLINSDSSSMKSSRVFPSESFNKIFKPEIYVKPNPATDWTTFYYELPDDASEGIIEITDVSGSVIKSFSVSGKLGQQLWDTRGIKSGVYLYTIKSNGFSKSGKIVINK